MLIDGLAVGRHEGILDEMQDRLDSNPDIMRTRSQTVEHSFGTLKAWMGATHFLTKTLKNVSTEMSLHVSGLQLKAGDEYHRNTGIDGSDGGRIRPFPP